MDTLEQQTRSAVKRVACDIIVRTLDDELMNALSQRELHEIFTKLDSVLRVIDG